MTEQHIHVWDKADFMQRILENEMLLKKLLQQFLQDAPNYLATLQQQSADGDLQGAKETAHTMKGIAANMSLGALKDCVCEMEKAVAADDVAWVQRAFADIQQCLQLTQQVLKQELE